MRVFNELGEVQCPVALNRRHPPGHRRRFRRDCGARAPTTASTSNALVPDTLTDLGGGACFNDARVQVASLGKTLRLLNAEWLKC